MEKKIIRGFLRSNICRMVRNQSSVALSFSSGTDSLALLFSCLDLGIRPVLYTYYVKDRPSEDLTRAHNLAERLSLPFYKVSIPNEPQSVLRQVKELLMLGVKGKVNIQCCQGHLNLAPHVKEHIILNGSGVDGLYGSYKSMLLKGCRKDKREFDKLRLKHLSNPNDDAMLDQKEIYFRLNSNCQVIYPYRESNVIDYLMGCSWEEINWPRMKEITVKEFPEIQEFKIYCPRGSQQIVAGTRSLHQELVSSRVFNPKHFTNVISIYNDLK